jgi:DNA-binding GntR family transcriptional regulator
MKKVRGNGSAEEYATSGPFATIFPSPEARILDQSLYVGNMEQTIAMLSESTNLSYKTVASALKRLISLGFITPTRKIGNAQAYKFTVENELHELLSWATRFQATRSPQ